MLMHLILHVATNPGPFIEPTLVTHAARWAHLAATVSAAPAVFGVICLLIRFVWQPHQNWKKVWESNAVAGFAVAAACLTAAFVAQSADVREMNAASDQAHVAYTASVVEFLATDYGLTVTERTADQLIAGGRAVVPIDGVDTDVELTSHENGDLALLTPLASR